MLILKNHIKVKKSNNKIKQQYNNFKDQNNININQSNNININTNQSINNNRKIKQFINNYTIMSNIASYLQSNLLVDVYCSEDLRGLILLYLLINHKQYNKDIIIFRLKLNNNYIEFILDNFNNLSYKQLILKTNMIVKSNVKNYLMKNNKTNHIFDICDKINDTCKYENFHDKNNIRQCLKNLNFYDNNIFFWDRYNAPNIGDIPEKTKVLIFNNNFNNKLLRYTIPSSVKFIYFGHNFNDDINDNVIPYGVEYLYFSHNYNKLITGIIPNSVKYLIIEGNININVGDIPNSVEYLKINYRNNIQNNALPLSIKYLDISIFSPINNNILPNSILYLDIKLKSYRLTQDLTDIIPPNVIELIVNNSLSRTIVKNVPDSVKYLTINYLNFELSKNVTHLHIIDNCTVKLSKYITHLTIGNQFSNFTIPDGDIPNSVIYLHLYITLKNKFIPNSVKFLTLSKDFDDIYIPSSVKCIKIMSNEPICNFNNRFKEIIYNRKNKSNIVSDIKCYYSEYNNLIYWDELKIYSNKPFILYNN